MDDRFVSGREHLLRLRFSLLGVPRALILFTGTYIVFPSTALHCGWIDGLSRCLAAVYEHDGDWLALHTVHIK